MTGANLPADLAQAICRIARDAGTPLAIGPVRALLASADPLYFHVDCQGKGCDGCTNLGSVPKSQVPEGNWKKVDTGDDMAGLDREALRAHAHRVFDTRHHVDDDALDEMIGYLHEKLAVKIAAQVTLARHEAAMQALPSNAQPIKRGYAVYYDNLGIETYTSAWLTPFQLYDTLEEAANVQSSRSAHYQPREVVIYAVPPNMAGKPLPAIPEVTRYEMGEMETGIGMFPEMQEKPDGSLVYFDDHKAYIAALAARGGLAPTQEQRLAFHPAPDGTVGAKVVGALCRNRLVPESEPMFCEDPDQVAIFRRQRETYEVLDVTTEMYRFATDMARGIATPTTELANATVPLQLGDIVQVKKGVETDDEDFSGRVGVVEAFDIEGMKGVDVRFPDGGGVFTRYLDLMFVSREAAKDWVAPDQIAALASARCFDFMAPYSPEVNLKDVLASRDKVYVLLPMADKRATELARLALAGAHAAASTGKD
jgi:hypothetical protein